MITVKISKQESKYQKVKVLGHALYDEYGKDIVCSAVSSIVITTVNGILSLDKDSISYLVSKKGLEIEVKSGDKIPQVLIANMVALLKELAKKYPDNIEIK